MKPKRISLFFVICLLAFFALPAYAQEAKTGRQRLGNSLSVNPATNIPTGTYIGDVRIGTGAFSIGTIGISQTGTANNIDVATLPATIKVTVTPTITAGAYTAKDCLGGEITFAAVVPISGGSGVLQAVVIADQDNETPALDLFFSGTNFTTNVADNAPLDILDADLPTVLPPIQFKSTDYIALADNAVGSRTNLGIPFKCDAQALYLYVQYNDVDAFTATTDISITIYVLPN